MILLVHLFVRYFPQRKSFRFLCFYCKYVLQRGKRERDPDRQIRREKTNTWMVSVQRIPFMPLQWLPLPQPPCLFIVVQKGLKTKPNLTFCPLLKLKLLSGLKVLVSFPPFPCLSLSALSFYFCNWQRERRNNVKKTVSRTRRKKFPVCVTGEHNHSHLISKVISAFSSNQL